MSNLSTTSFCFVFKTFHSENCCEFNGEIWMVGVEFGKEERNVVRFDAERL